MKRSLFLVAIMATSGWASATYTFTSTNYSGVTTFTSCAVGPCANYTTSMHITGSFTLASALPPNFSGATDISSQITAYSFSDGINTYANTDPNARIYQFNIATDGTGNISVGSILLEVWQSGTSPHSAGDRVTLVNLNGPTINQSENNLGCTMVTNGGTGSGVADVCQFASSDGSSSAASSDMGSYSGPSGGGGGGPTAVPTLGEWGMIFLTVLLGGFAWLRLRRTERIPPAV